MPFLHDPHSPSYPPPRFMAAEPCEMSLPCPVGERSYHALVPDGWDGVSKLPVLLHFHGWGRQGPLIMKHSRIAGATRKHGVLLLAPNGQGRSWRFWSKDTRDVPFASSVLADAARRWPIDTSRIYVSGYSYGAAMAWRYACEAGRPIAALLAISGSFPDQRESCLAPVNVRHVHGTTDTVMAYPFGTDGDIDGPVALWRDRNGCAGAPRVSRWQAVKVLPIERHEWPDCTSGKSVILDVHKGGHFIPRFWIDRQLTQLLGKVGG